MRLGKIPQKSSRALGASVANYGASIKRKNLAKAGPWRLKTQNNSIQASVSVIDRSGQQDSFV